MISPVSNIRLDQIRLDAKEVGLIVIDMQNSFCHPEGARARAFGPGSAVEMVRAIIPNITRLIGVCRDSGVRIWFTRQVHYPNDLRRAARRIPSHLDRRGVKLELSHRGTWEAEIVDEIKEQVRPEDEVIVKHRASAFYNSPLEPELRIQGIQVLIIAGTTTSFCVDSTIRDAYMRDFDVLVPAECVADTDAEAQAAVLKSTDRFHGVVTNIEQIQRVLVPAKTLVAAGA
jgi:ureidoacrylate peracid hydrolase